MHVDASCCISAHCNACGGITGACWHTASTSQCIVVHHVAGRRIALQYDACRLHLDAIRCSVMHRYLNAPGCTYDAARMQRVSPTLPMHLGWGRINAKRCIVQRHAVQMHSHASWQNASNASHRVHLAATCSQHALSMQYTCSQMRCRCT